MSDLPRHPVNLPPDEDRRLTERLEVGTPALRMLEQESDCAAYYTAVAEGDFDDAGAWVEEARASRRRGWDA